MSETEVARTLAASRIFMAFSDFEGLPIPPVEAALAGNFVIGYTGQGGREYWNPPVFEAIESGDIVRFIDVVLKRVNDMDTFGLCVGVNHLTMLTEYFSKEMEAKTLKKMIERIDG
jgi:glycosyltransferase involved in cell wall biosynthesis